MPVDASIPIVVSQFDRRVRSENPGYRGSRLFDLVTDDRGCGEVTSGLGPTPAEGYGGEEKNL
jgi:hypothetical protein